jgi:hypothetical protein
MAYRLTEMDFNSTHIEQGVSRLQDLISPVASGSLEIVVPDKRKGRYELPQPAHTHIPDWYKRTELNPLDDEPLKKTVRACMPFMEALTFGWVIPTPTDISITHSSDGLEIKWEDISGFTPVGNHPKGQVGGDAFPHDGEILKFNLPYTLRTPEGVSTLYMPPLNRIETRFRPFSGVVDTDKYINETNIPALLLDDGFEGVIEAGTPLVQVIPFERDSLVNESKTRTATDEEEELMEHEDKAVPAVDAYYKEEVWEPKKASRETGDCPFGFGGDDE